jgi:hypothetical protein
MAIQSTDKQQQQQQASSSYKPQVTSLEASTFST